MPSLYHELLEEILEGDLQPGTILVESALGQRFGVSRTPVREALRMLEQDGVLERVNRGMRVRQTSAEEVLEIYSVRAILESAAARFAAQNRTDYDLATLERLLRTMHETKDLPPEEMASINRSYHRAIWQAGKNRTLSDLLERLAVQGSDGRVRRDASEAAARIREARTAPAQLAGLRDDVETVREEQQKLREKVEAISRS